VNTFTNYLEKFGSNFLVSAMIPSLGLVTACMVVFDPILHISAAFQTENGIYSYLGIGLLVTAPTVIIGFTLTALNTFILKLFEGYVFFHHFDFMRNIQEKRAHKLITERDAIRNDIEYLIKKKRRSIEEEFHLETLKSRYDAVVSKYDHMYPPLSAGIMPTKFGNILKASEAYSGTRYGIDAVEFWPRLLHVIPPSYRQSIDEVRNELSFLVNMSALSIVFYLLCVTAILTNASGFPDWEGVLETSVRYIVAAGLALVSNWFFNRAAIFSVTDFGMMIRSAYDLFRFDLLEQFRLKQPKNSAEEFQIWSNLGELMILGQESLDFKHLKYAIKEGNKKRARASAQNLNR
jgi:hypothetical protein